MFPLACSCLVVLPPPGWQEEVGLLEIRGGECTVDEEGAQIYYMVVDTGVSSNLCPLAPPPLAVYSYSVHGRCLFVTRFGVVFSLTAECRIRTADKEMGLGEKTAAAAGGGTCCLSYCLQASISFTPPSG